MTDVVAATKAKAARLAQLNKEHPDPKRGANKDRQRENKAAKKAWRQKRIDDENDAYDSMFGFQVDTSATLEDLLSDPIFKKGKNKRSGKQGVKLASTSASSVVPAEDWEDLCPVSGDVDSTQSGSTAENSARPASSLSPPGPASTRGGEKEDDGDMSQCGTSIQSEMTSVTPLGAITYACKAGRDLLRPGYAFVDVGAGSRGPIRFDRAARTCRSVKRVGVYHGLSPVMLPTDVATDDDRCCSHLLRDCDCVEGERLWFFYHSAYYMTSEDLSRIHPGDVVVAMYHVLQDGESVLVDGKKMTRVGDRMQCVAPDGLTLFEHPCVDWSHGFKTNNAELLVSDFREVGSVHVVRLVANSLSSTDRAFPEVSLMEEVFDWTLSVTCGLVRHVAGYARSIFVVPESQEGNETEVERRAQVLLASVKVDGQERRKLADDLMHVAKTLAKEHANDVSVVSAAKIVTAQLPSLERAYDHFLVHAEKALQHNAYRAFYTLGPRVRVVMAVASVVWLARGLPMPLYGPYKWIGKLGVGIAVLEYMKYELKSLVERCRVVRRLNE